MKLVVLYSNMCRVHTLCILAAWICSKRGERRAGTCAGPAVRDNLCGKIK